MTQPQAIQPGRRSIGEQMALVIAWGLVVGLAGCEKAPVVTRSAEGDSKPIVTSAKSEVASVESLPGREAETERKASSESQPGSELRPEQVAAISRHGSADAMQSVLQTITGMPAGQAKIDLCKSLEVAGRSDLHPWLLDVLLATDDVEVSRALREEMGKVATTELLASAIAAYDRGTDPAQQQRALDFLQGVSGDASVPPVSGALLDLSRPVSEPVNQALARALAANGSGQAVDTLLRRLSQTSDADKTRFMTDLVRGVSRTEAGPQLLGATRGNKNASTIDSRIAAIQALQNYPTIETLNAMQAMTNDPDPRIRRASSQVVEICNKVLKR